MLIAGCGAIEYLRRRELPRLTRIDWWIIMYIVVLTVITVVNGF